MSSTSNSSQACVITNGDSLIGYALAFRFLQGMKSGELNKRCIRLLCRQTEGLELHRLEEMGAEICQIDYQKESEVKKALENAQSVILIPEHSNHRVKEAEHVIQVAKKNQIKHFAVISMLGVEQFLSKVDDAHANSEYRNFCQLAQIELMALKALGEKCVAILRTTMINQLYYFMAPEIENKKKVCLPVKEDAKWSSVDLNDVVEGIFQMAMKKHERNETFSSHMFNFTGCHAKSAKQMVEDIQEGLGVHELKFHQVKPEEMKEWLQNKREDKQFKKRPDTHSEFGKGRDGVWSIPIGKFLNDQKIELLLEFWCLANKGKQDMITNDLKSVLQRDPQDFKQYFKTNRDLFKQFK